MTADDRCTIEKEFATEASISSPEMGRIYCPMIVLLVGAGIAFVIGIFLRPRLLPRSKGYTVHLGTTSLTPSPIPFVFIRNPSSRDTDDKGSIRRPIGRIIRSVMDSYQTECSQALSGMSQMLEQAIASEENFATQETRKTKLLSTKIERRIHRTATCLEHDEEVLTKLLHNFSYVMALPDKSVRSISNKNGNGSLRNETQPTAESSSTNYRFQERSAKVVDDSETRSYDSATQIWAHLVRDWTVEGKVIRHNIYGWCCQQMESYAKKAATVLVPGSGMGRLAYDLYQQGYHVEANELSPTMAAAASAVLRSQVFGKFHPYVLDSMANEVDSKRRFDEVRFPDVVIQKVASSTGSLSYTVGDFVGTNDDYYRHQRVGHFDAVVTCFFIDTATNIYDYIETIQALLRPRTGVWINVGPVQWHRNARLRPSVDELKDLIEALGWTIKLWSVDTTPVSYRDENRGHKQPRMTSYDGYRPLRLVAIPPK